MSPAATSLRVLPHRLPTEIVARMMVGAYGMFWHNAAVEWFPGSGSRSWSMLGRVGERNPKLKLVDFRKARGVYVLFDDHGAYYAGKAGSDGGLGARLKQHQLDEHRGRWDRFCWFSFDGISSRPGPDGLHSVKPRERLAPTDNAMLLREMEGLLITILNTRNKVAVNFGNAVRWEQVLTDDEESLYRGRVARRP